MKRDLCADFERFHADNPHVYAMFKKFTFRAIDRGFRNLSADMVLHRIRWETHIETSDTASDFKINNNYSAFYGRLFMQDYPEHDGFFRTRISAADRAPGVTEQDADILALVDKLL